MSEYLRVLHILITKQGWGLSIIHFTNLAWGDDQGDSICELSVCNLIKGKVSEHETDPEPYLRAAKLHKIGERSVRDPTVGLSTQMERNRFNFLNSELERIRISYDLIGCIPILSAYDCQVILRDKYFRWTLKSFTLGALLFIVSHVVCACLWKSGIKIKSVQLISLFFTYACVSR